jgi:hypothetical protein
MECKLVNSDVSLVIHVWGADMMLFAPCQLLHTRGLSGGFAVCS